MKDIFFIDLDNTIYFTKPNQEQLMSDLYSLLDAAPMDMNEEDYKHAKEEMLSTPFLKVAQKYNFPKETMERAVHLLANREVTKPLRPSDDYHYIKSLSGRKFIVTAGFPKQQFSKVKMLGIWDDFELVHVVDVGTSNKKEAFLELIQQYELDPEKILVIGDDADSEIKYGLEMGLDTFLLDPEDRYPAAESTFRGVDFNSLRQAAGQ